MSPANWSDIHETLVTYFLSATESWNGEIYIKPGSETIPEGFIIDDNALVEFLPQNLHRFFPSLVAIQVFNCSLKRLDESNFKQLGNLRTLNLLFNKIETIPSDSFRDLESLEFLYIGFNRIQVLGATVFASLKNLRGLFLSDNEIQLLHSKIFNSLEKVETIELDNNEISSLDENLFRNLHSLKNVTLNDNKLVAIPSALFKSNLNLAKIWLNRNKIKFLDSENFNHLSDLVYVDVSENICINKVYDEHNFGDIHNDLTANCVTLDEKIKELEKQITILNDKINAANELEN